MTARLSRPYRVWVAKRNYKCKRIVIKNVTKEKAKQFKTRFRNAGLISWYDMAYRTF